MQKKFLTFSFDDCTQEDIRLVSLMNRYGIKGTFNLTSSWLTAKNRSLNCQPKTVCHINYTENMHLYDGHEIACHSYSHPNLLKCDDETVYNEIFLDKKILEYLFNRNIFGIAYPGGGYDEKIIEIARRCGLKYGRTVNRTYDFSLPREPMALHPSCHFKCPETEELAESFINGSSDIPQLFYIWGHSYELETEDDWTRLEALFEKLSNRNDICYCTNIEALKKLGLID